MRLNGVFDRARLRRRSAVVTLDHARQQKRVSRYLPLWVGALGFLFTMVFSQAVPGFFVNLPGAVADLFNRAIISVDHSLSAQSTIHFSQCHQGGGMNCVVDGDTFWIGGMKVRVSDIDAPETHPSRCPHEAALGERAANRLQELLNAGPIELWAGRRDKDVYGRKLRIVSRDGRSLGMRLVSEGLARKWDGARRPWC